MIDHNNLNHTSQNEQKKEKKVKSKIKLHKKNHENTLWWFTLVTIIAVSCGTRWYKIFEPDKVCFDEVHFGKMSSYYINRTFFMDVHPPLGKMLIALSGYLSGFDGKFNFNKIGDPYGNVNYVGMRIVSIGIQARVQDYFPLIFCATLGMCIVPFGFLTVWEMTKSLNAAILAAVFILCDVGILTLSRFILLEPVFLFFMMGTVYSTTKFHSFFHRPFSKTWWRWLLLMGLMMTCCISVKFVGLFTVIFVGLRTIEELWEILISLETSFYDIVKHLVARCIVLIIFPILFYVLVFFIHLTVLYRSFYTDYTDGIFFTSFSGTGDGFYGFSFQSTLIGNSLYEGIRPREVAYGAVISLKNRRVADGYLHSHSRLYPKEVGAPQQQITSYMYKDKLNLFRVKPYNKTLSENSPIELLKHGDLIILEHVVSQRNLHSHNISAAIARNQKQVTAYGSNGTGDINDVWRVLIEGGSEGEIVKTFTSKLKFVHYLQRCALVTSGHQLPEWAIKQREVACNPNLRDKGSLWSVDDNIHGKLPNVSIDVRASNFLERFIESHSVMIEINSSFKPMPGKDTSKPWQWPINYKGHLFFRDKSLIYLLGNPIIWWGNLALLVIFWIFCHNTFPYQSQRTDSRNIARTKAKLLYSCKWLFLGWSLHYVPFWTMDRILYFHHYFPASLFNSMLSSVVISYILVSAKKYLSGKLINTVYHSVIALIYSSVFYRCVTVYR